jgi:hypothetical protein
VLAIDGDVGQRSVNAPCCPQMIRQAADCNRHPPKGSLLDQGLAEVLRGSSPDATLRHANIMPIKRASHAIGALISARKFIAAMSATAEY